MRQKIVYREISENLNATYIDKEIFTNNKLYIVTGSNLKYLTAFLNSTVVNNLLNTANLTGGKGVSYLEQLPIPKISTTAQQPFVKLADKILTNKQNGKDTTALEIQIDTMVYRLYNLTAYEIKLLKIIYNLSSIIAISLMLKPYNL